MSDSERFRFFSEGLPEQNLHVVSFTGEEGLGRLFSLKINLVCDNPDLDLSALLSNKAVFSIAHGQGPNEDGGTGSGKASSFYGYPVSATQKGSYKGYTYYAVDLCPDLWLLTRTVESSIFLNQGVADVAFSILTAHKMRAIPYESRLMRHHPEQEFAMQYGESMFDYLVWRLEQEGAYFYFDPADGKLILADSPQSHAPSAATFLYSPISGLAPSDGEEMTVSSFSLSQSFLPNQVVVRSYDWKNPNKVVVGKAEVSPSGIGDVYLADEAVESDSEAGRIASIRAEEIVCHSRVFHGSSTIPSLRPGCVFDLKGHYAKSFEQSFLVTEVVHEGSQESFLSLGLGIPLRDFSNHLFYRNTFSCIESDVPFRPKRASKRAKVSGSIRAFIDGPKGGKPEMDKYGRYKLLFPFDVSGRKEGKASCWIRMARPHMGKQSSLNLPICPGTEVLVSFIDGNPDRPVITGALANGENPLATSSSISGITTNGGNVFALNDTGTKQGIAMLTAAGVGSVTSSGSISTTVDSQDRVLTSASLSAAMYASGYISSTACIRNTVTATKDLATYIGGLLPMIGDTLKKIYTSVDHHSDAGDTTVSWISSMVPLINDIIICVEDLKQSPIGYGLTAVHDGNASTLNLFVDMEKTEMALRVLPPFLLRAGVRAVDVAMDIKNGDTRYDQNTKKPTKSEISIATIKDLLPEILSLIIVFAGMKKKNTIGGIGIQAKESNVNITAKTVASMHAGRYIVLSTNNLNNDVAFDRITEIGTNSTDQDLNIGNKENINPNPKKTNRFIKINTEVMHTDNDYSIFRNKKKFHSEATEHRFFSFNQLEGNQDTNKAELSLVYKPGDGQDSSKSTIKLHANEISLGVGYEQGNENQTLSGSLELCKKASLSFKFDTEEDEIILDKDNIKIGIKKNDTYTNSIAMKYNNNKPTTEIACGNSTSINIDGEDSISKISLNATTVDFSSSKVNIGKIIAKNNQNGTTEGTLKIEGSMVKIC